MKNMIITIDTSDRTKSIVTLEFDRKLEKLEVDTPLGSGTAVLSGIESLLAKNSLNLNDISRIRVATGPGSYTGLRVGASIANTLSWILRVPVNDKPIGTYVTKHHYPPFTIPIDR
mgnify:CR=1 FL=1